MYCDDDLSAILVAATLSRSFFVRCRRQKNTTIPTIAASASTEPATAPAIAPPLISFISTGDDEVEGAPAVTVAGWALVSEEDGVVDDA